MPPNWNAIPPKQTINILFPLIILRKGIINNIKICANPFNPCYLCSIKPKFNEKK